MESLDEVRQQVRELVSEGCWESAHILCHFLTTASASMTARQKSEDIELFADIVYGQGEHRRALHFYRAAQSLVRTRSGATASTPVDDGAHDGDAAALKGEAELRFKVARCYTALKEYKLALAELETINSSHRSLPARLLLGKLYLQMGQESSATQVYLECVRACPHALEAVSALARLRVPASIIKAQLPAAFASPAGHDDLAIASWLPALIDGQAAAAALQYDDAVRHFTRLEQRAFPGNPSLLLVRATPPLSPSCSLAAAQALPDAPAPQPPSPGQAAAEAEAALGKLTTAATLFSHVRQTDPYGSAGMDTYAAVAAATGGLDELHRITVRLLETNSRRPEAWAAAALYWKAKRDPLRALAFAEKGAQLDEAHPACHLIVGDLALQLNNPDAAVQAFRRAAALRPDTTSFTGLVRACLAAGRKREAHQTAKEAVKRAPGSARALVLLGDVLEEQPERARKYYLQAMKADPQSVEAAVALAEAYSREGRLQDAAALLQGQASGTQYRDPMQHAAVLAKLGLVLAAMRCFDRAIGPLQAALSIAPGFEEAKRGLERVDRMLRGMDPDSPDDDALQVEDVDDGAVSPGGDYIA